MEALDEDEMDDTPDEEAADPVPPVLHQSFHALRVVGPTIEADSCSKGSGKYGFRREKKEGETGSFKSRCDG